MCVGLVQKQRIIPTDFRKRKQQCLLKVVVAGLNSPLAFFLPSTIAGSIITKKDQMQFLEAINFVTIAKAL